MHGSLARLRAARESSIFYYIYTRYVCSLTIKSRLTTHLSPRDLLSPEL